MSPPRIIQTITITESESGTWFARSEDDPPLFVAAHSREAVNAGLVIALQKQAETGAHILVIQPLHAAP